MFTFNLANLPDQSFTTNVGNSRYDIRLFQINGTMACDIARNGTQLVSGQRILTGFYIIPYLYQWATEGNFILLTKNNALPDYTQFGLTQTFVFASWSDILAAFST